MWSEALLFDYLLILRGLWFKSWLCWMILKNDLNFEILYLNHQYYALNPFTEKIKLSWPEEGPQKMFKMLLYYIFLDWLSKKQKFRHLQDRTDFYWAKLKTYLTLLLANQCNFNLVPIFLHFCHLD